MTRDEFAKAWKEDGNPGVPPEVDFSKETVVAVFGGPAAAGNDLRIEQLSSRKLDGKGMTNIVYRETTAETGKAVSQHVVVVDKFDGAYGFTRVAVKESGTKDQKKAAGSNNAEQQKANN